MWKIWNHILAFFLAASVGVPGWWIFGDRKPPYTEFSVSVSPQRVLPGESVTIRLTGQVNRHCDGVIRRQLVDADGNLHGIKPVAPALAGAVGRTFTIERQVAIPIGAKPGPMTYEGYQEYHCNPLQFLNPIRIRTTRVTFQVVASPDGGLLERNRTLARYLRAD